MVGRAYAGQEVEDHGIYIAWDVYTEDTNETTMSFFSRNILISLLTNEPRIDKSVVKEIKDVLSKTLFVFDTDRKCYGIDI